jgi:hypothetical protein
MPSRQALRAAPATESISGWLPPAVLEPLVEINRHCIDLLCDLAAANDYRSAVIKDLAPLWRSLTPASRQLLATCPFLLVDAGFADEQRWRRLRVPHSPEAQRVSADAPLPLPAGFTRRVLVYGWHLARSEPSMARLALGMTAECLSQVAALGLHEIDQLCEQYPGWVRPRWETRPDVWRPLLQAVGRPTEATLQRMRLRGIQLLAGAALPGATPPR